MTDRSIEDEDLTEEERYHQEEPKKKKAMAPEQREHLRELNKGRAKKIKALAAYWHTSYGVAQQKLKGMEDSDPIAIEELLEKANRGEVGSIPVCPTCTKDMLRRIGKFGEFWSCSNYPHCRGTRPIKSEILKITQEKQKEISDKVAAAMSYIDKMGGSDEALRYLNIAILALTEAHKE